MKILPVNSNNNNSFKRKPTVKEMEVYTNSVNEGLKLLNKRVDIIIHNSSAPAIPSENTGIAGKTYSVSKISRFYRYSAGTE